MPASVPGSFIRPERAPGQRIGPAFCVQAPPPAIRVSPMAAPLFGQRFHPAGLNALATGGAIQPALSFAWARLGPVLIKIGFGRCRATLVIAIGVERGQNSLVTIASWPLPGMAGRGRAEKRRGVSMSVILSLLGIVVAAVGIAAIGFGIPINEFTLGTTLIVAGVTALTGGLILIGLAAVVAELGRLAEAVRTRIAVRPGARPAEAP